MREVKKEEGVETQALRRGIQECVGSENVTELQTPGWDKQDPGRNEKAWKIQVSRGRIQKQPKLELQVGWGNQGLRRVEDARERQISRRKNLREIKVDWVMIQALWWEDQTPVAIGMDREFQTPCWGNQDRIGGEYRTEIQAPEERDQRKDRSEGGT